MSHTPDPCSTKELSRFERFRWNTLGDLAFEDAYALWEVAASANASFRDLPLSEQRNLAEQAVRELLAEDKIFLFRLGGLDPNRAAEEPSLRLELEEAQSEVTRTLQADDPSVAGDLWLAPTEVGVRAANDPPPAVRRLWGWDT